jgi:hypothetical protein
MRCVTRSHSSEQLVNLLGESLTMTYNAIHHSEGHGVDNRRGMKTFYQSLKDTTLPSCYKVASMTRACAVVQSRKKSEKRGVTASHPRPLRPMVCIISGFFTIMKGRLFITLRRPGEDLEAELTLGLEK